MFISLPSFRFVFFTTACARLCPKPAPLTCINSMITAVTLILCLLAPSPTSKGLVLVILFFILAKSPPLLENFPLLFVEAVIRVSVFLAFYPFCPLNPHLNIFRIASSSFNFCVTFPKRSPNRISFPPPPFPSAILADFSHTCFPELSRTTLRRVFPWYSSPLSQTGGAPTFVIPFRSLPQATHRSI